MKLYQDRDPAFRLFDDIVDLPAEPVGDHLSDSDALRYVAGRLSTEDEMRQDQHLASCEECLKRVETVLAAYQTDVLGPIQDEQRAVDRSEDVRQLLAKNAAFEEGCDYVVPSGHHVGVHVNLGRLCWSENAIDGLARLLAQELRRVSFDAILTHGWPMATVVRRLTGHYITRPIKLIESEGYKDPILSRSLGDQSTVVVLLDVVISGSLARQLTARIRKAGSKVVSTFAVVGASDGGFEHGVSDAM